MAIHSASSCIQKGEIKSALQWKSQTKQCHLALKPFSSMVAAAALTNRGPFNIGVFSGWGQGKTSVLRQAVSLIREQEKPNIIE